MEDPFVQNKSKKRKSITSTVESLPTIKRKISNIRSNRCDRNIPGLLIVSDIGNSINDRRKGLLQMVDKVIEGTLRTLYLSHKDRLCRFGFELLQHIFHKCGSNIVVDEEDDKSPEQELVEDLINIITIFSCKLRGKRRYKRKNNQEGTKRDDGKPKEWNEKKKKEKGSKFSGKVYEDKNLSEHESEGSFEEMVWHLTSNME